MSVIFIKLRFIKKLLLKNVCLGERICQENKMHFKSSYMRTSFEAIFLDPELQAKGSINV